MTPTPNATVSLFDKDGRMTRPFHLFLNAFVDTTPVDDARLVDEQGCATSILQTLLSGINPAVPMPASRVPLVDDTGKPTRPMTAFMMRVAA